MPESDHPESRSIQVDIETLLGEDAAYLLEYEATGGPAFSTGAGLLKLALREPPVAVKDLGDLRVDGGSFGRVGRWLKANL